jgi:hypothetical protein
MHLGEHVLEHDRLLLNDLKQLLVYLILIRQLWRWHHGHATCSHAHRSHTHPNTWYIHRHAHSH